MQEPLVQEPQDPHPPLVTKQTSDNLKHQVVLPTPIKVTILDLYLEGYGPDERKFLIAGFSRGFSLGTVGEIPPTLSKNHVSVSPIHTKFIQTKLSKEISLGRIKGPYTQPPLESFKCSPLGVVPKKEPNTFRLIHQSGTKPKQVIKKITETSY